MPSMLLLFSLSGDSQNFEKVYSKWTKLNEKIKVCLLEVCITSYLCGMAHVADG